MSDYAALPTDVLARETLKRARGVDDLNDKAWLWVAVLLLAPYIAAIITFMVTFDWRWSVLLAVLVAAGPLSRWLEAIAECERFTKEMMARREELERRTASTHP